MSSPPPGGRRSRSVSYIAIRLTLLAFLIVGGALFHHHGHGYDVVHAIYIVAVVGFLGWRLWRRSMWQRSRPTRHRPADSESSPEHGPGPMV
jgi:hypothetical protein